MISVIRLLLVILAVSLAGCATTEQRKDDERISSIPWAKPEGWQNQGAFGGMMQPGR